MSRFPPEDQPIATGRPKAWEALVDEIRSKPIVFILVLASILRLWGIWHGYPFSYYPDEQHLVNRAVSFGSGDLNPHWFHKPGFLMYLLFFEYVLFFLVGKVAGIFQGVDSFAVYFFRNSWPFVIIGRITVALFGIATVYMVYRIGKRFWSKSAGLYGALFLALSYGHVFGGQDVKADVPCVFFTVVSMYYLIRVAKEGFRTRDYILSGLFAGLGTATKYYSIIFLPSILLVSAWEIFTRKNARLFVKYIYSVAAFWGIYFAVSPFNFIDPLGRRSTFGMLTRIWNRIVPLKINLFPPLEGQNAADFLGRNIEGNYILHSISNYFKVMFSTEGAGIVIGILFCLSAIWFLRKASLAGAALLSFPFIFSFVAVISYPSYAEVRHQLVVYPFLCLAAGISLAGFSFSGRRPLKVACVTAALLLFPLGAIIANNIHHSRTDTRTMAKYWIEENIPSGTRLMLDEYSPVLYQSKAKLEELYAGSRDSVPGQFTVHMPAYYRYQIEASYPITYDIREIRHIWWRRSEDSPGEKLAVTEYDRDMANPLKPVGVNDLDHYIEDGYQFVITSSIVYGAYLDENSSKSRNFPMFWRFYDELFRRGDLVKEFDPRQSALSGPTVKIFRLPSSGTRG